MSKRNHSVVRIEEPKFSIVTHRRRKKQAHSDKLGNQVWQSKQASLRGKKAKEGIESDPMFIELNLMLSEQRENNTNTEIIEESSDPRSKCRPKYYTKSGRGRGGRFANV